MNNLELDISLVCVPCNNRGIREVVYGEPTGPLIVKKETCPDCNGESCNYDLVLKSQDSVICL